MLRIMSRGITHLSQFKPLLYELVIRDIKIKYRRSVLGYIWSLLNPLMMMAIMTIVFSHVFRANVQNYPLYLICGQILFAFFSESSNLSMYSILNNATLIKKIYIPKFIFPISRVVSSFVNLGFSLTAVLIVMVITRAPVYWTIILVFLPIILLFIFCTGIGLALSSLTVYFKDIKHLWGVIVTAWMYCTPIFYSVDMLPERVQMLLSFNPMYYYIMTFRELLMLGTVPHLRMWIGCTVSATLSLGLGLIVFDRLQRDFILHI